MAASQQNQGVRRSTSTPPKAQHSDLWYLFHHVANDNYIPFSYWIKRVLPLALIFGMGFYI